MSSRWLDSALAPLGTRPRASQRLVAVPYRHAGLIAACALAGALAASAPLLLHARTPPAATAREVAIAPWAEVVPAPGLRLDVEPGRELAGDDDAPAQENQPLAGARPGSAAPLQLDDARELDEIERALRESPPAAGPGLDDGHRRHLGELGVAVGLLLGLLAAAWRELPGQRMRSPREAEWALGAPVLAAIPTLSGRARAALLAPAART